MANIVDHEHDVVLVLGQEEVGLGKQYQKTRNTRL